MTKYLNTETSSLVKTIKWARIFDVLFLREA